MVGWLRKKIKTGENDKNVIVAISKRKCLTLKQDALSPESYLYTQHMFV